MTWKEAKESVTKAEQDQFEAMMRQAAREAEQYAKRRRDLSPSLLGFPIVTIHSPPDRDP